MEICSIQGCYKTGIQRYDLYCNKPHFMTMIYCKGHSETANIVLAKRKLKVRPDGTYSNIN